MQIPDTIFLKASQEQKAQLKKNKVGPHHHETYIGRERYDMKNSF